MLSSGEERRPERVAVVFLLLVLSFRVARLQSFFALAVLFGFATPIARLYQRHRAARTAAAGAEPPRTGLARPAFITAAIACAITAAGAWVIAVNLGNLVIDPRFTPEPGAVSFLQAQPAGRRVLVWFDWGEYSIWHLTPRMQVSIDGRRETVYSAGMQNRHLRFYYAASPAVALPRELGADYVWIPRTLPAARKLQSARDWRVVYRGDTSIIFGRAGLEPVNTPMASLSPVHRTFPGP